MESEVIQTLTALTDPDSGESIVQLGYVQDLNVTGDAVSLTLAMPLPMCESVRDLPTQVESTVTALESISSCSVQVRPQDVRRTNPGGPSGIENTRAIIAVSSCKGGVGKSTIAAALAKDLASRGHKTGLLDADVFGPSVPTLFGLHDAGIVADQNQNMIPIDVDGLKVMSFGFMLGRRPAVMRGPMVSNYIQQALHRVAWGELDFLIIDMPPGTGDIQLTISQSIQLDGAIIVTTPQALSLTDVEKGILMFDQVNVPVLGVLENMAWFECGNCSTRHHVFGDETRSLTERFGLDVLAGLPLDPATYGQGMANAAPPDAIHESNETILNELRRQMVGATRPPSVTFDEDAVHFAWADGAVSTISNLDLRAACQCALCVHEFSGEQLLKREDIRSDIAAKEARPIGNYAVAIVWNDGHDSGLFSYDRIRSLAQEGVPAS